MKDVIASTLQVKKSQIYLLRKVVGLQSEPRSTVSKVSFLFPPLPPSWDKQLTQKAIYGRLGEYRYEKPRASHASRGSDAALEPPSQGPSWSQMPVICILSDAAPRNLSFKAEMLFPLLLSSLPARLQQGGVGWGGVGLFSGSWRNSG